jgi:hypothetical protein
MDGFAAGWLVGLVRAESGQVLQLFVVVVEEKKVLSNEQKAEASQNRHLGLISQAVARVGGMPRWLEGEVASQRFPGCAALRLPGCSPCRAFRRTT